MDRFAYASGGSTLCGEHLELTSLSVELALLASHGAALEERRTARGRERRGFDGLTNVAQEALDARWRDDEGAELHPRAAAIALVAIDVEGSLEKPGPPPILTAMRRGLLGVAVIVGDGLRRRILGRQRRNHQRT